MAAKQVPIAKRMNPASAANILRAGSDWSSPVVVNGSCRTAASIRNKMASATRNHTVFLSYFDNPLKDAIAVCMRLGDMLGARCVPTIGGPLTKSDAAYAAKVAAKMRA